MTRRFVLVAAVVLFWLGTPAIAAEIDHPEARPFDGERAALAEIVWALTRATVHRKRVILVMGANWCHDSRGLAGWFETPRFAAMLEDRYEIVYVDVGRPQEGAGRNIDIARRFGIEEIAGTPTVLVLSPEGTLLNAETAPGWRNAASRSEDEIFDYFADFRPE
ncbi:MAG: thioredoxin family protein [Parasphingopyxis sp.]|uniref:thioredoxin family protein n=1 Tax=Parasphingopyxis sp. TaxID=1920299 RepID=UPI003FA11663